MNPEQLAIILEAASYILVTTDLYGKERIKNLQTKVKNAITHSEELYRTSPGERLFKVFGWLLEPYTYDIERKIKWPFWRVLSGVVLGIVFLGITSYMAVFVMEWHGRSMWGLKNIVFFSYTLVAIWGAIFILPMLIFMLLFGLEGITVTALTMVLFFLEKLNLEGTMLIVGSILFVHSCPLKNILACGLGFGTSKTPRHS